MIKKSKLYKVICNGMDEQCVLADSFKEAEDIVNQYLQEMEYKFVTIECISKKGDILHADNKPKG